MKPTPENIEGQVVKRHSFEHKVDWSHVLLGAVVLVAVVKLSPAVAQMAGSEGRGGR